MSSLDLCAYLGLAAVGAVCVNMLLGMLIALRYSPVRMWPHRKINVFRLHNWSAYAVLALILLHPAVLLVTDSPHFGVGDLLLPVSSPVQPKLNTVGAAALYILLIVILTSLLRRHMPRPLWRKLHYLVFPAAILMLIHGLFTDPSLKTGKADLLDGEKVFVEICCLISIASWAYRFRRRGRGFRQERAAFSSTGK